jgi:hypothetical protein
MLFLHCQSQRLSVFEVGEYYLRISRILILITNDGCTLYLSPMYAM